jgi:hypothetical protein
MHFDCGGFMNHTVTPWTLNHIGGSNFAVQEFEIRGMFGDKPNVHPIFNKDRSAIDGATIFCRQEDAAFIVRACNAHDELVNALEELINERQPLGIDRTAYQNALAAIDKATGEQP